MEVDGLGTFICYDPTQRRRRSQHFLKLSWRTFQVNYVDVILGNSKTLRTGGFISKRSELPDYREEELHYPGGFGLPQ